MKKWLLSALAVLSFASLSFALSPFQTVAGVGGPMPGTSMSCTSVQVSTVTSTSILAANATRESLYIINTSTQAIVAGARAAAVWISTYPITASTQPDFTTMGAFPIFPSDYRAAPSTATIQGSSRFETIGDAVWQGPIYGIADGPSGTLLGGHVNACELNP